jgi:hypothetical protein
VRQALSRAASVCPVLPVSAKGFARSSPQPDRRHGVRGPRGQLPSRALPVSVLLPEAQRRHRDLYTAPPPPPWAPVAHITAAKPRRPSNKA